MQLIKKLHLKWQIKKFYKTFGEEVGANFINKLSDMTDDNIMSVTFDINEILQGYEGYEAFPMYSWLIKLERRCLQCKC